jgi:hypothetical protein
MIARYFLYLVLILTSPLWLPIVVNRKWGEAQRRYYAENASHGLIFHPEDYGGWN